MSGAAAPGLRVALRAADPVRRHGLAAILEATGHVLTTETPDVVLCDLALGEVPPVEAEAPVVVLSDRALRGPLPAGVLPRAATARQLDLALRSVAAGLLVRSPDPPADGFAAAADEPPSPLTPREAEILALVGQGMSNKAVARRLGISVHTVKFHLEALFAKLDAASRAEAVAKGLRGGVIEL